jgi:hypothetical protein
MYLERKITRTPRWLWTVSLMEPIGAWSRKVVVANSLKNMVGPCGLEPQTSTLSKPILDEELTSYWEMIE